MATQKSPNKGGKISNSLPALAHTLVPPYSSPARLVKLINNQMIIQGKDALAEEFDVSITTIERWLREGVPREGQTDNNFLAFHRGKVAKWRREIHGQNV